MSTEILGRWPQWRDKLILELRMRNVSGREIGEILAEVDQHVREGGEPPVDAFGDPVDYARSRSETIPTPPTGRRIVVLAGIFMACFLGGALAAGGAWAVGAGDLRWGPLPAWLALGVGLALLVGVMLLGKPDLITDPGSGTPLSGFATKPHLVMIAGVLATISVITLVGWFSTG